MLIASTLAPPMPGVPDCPQPLLRAVVRLTEAFRSLPALPTMDWPDAAANALALTCPDSAAVVVLATVDRNLTLTDHEGVGAGISVAEIAPTSGRAQTTPAAPDQRAALLADLRTLGECLNSLGATTQSTEGVAGAAQAIAGPAWRAGALGALAARLPRAEFILGATPLAGTLPGRALAVVWAVPTPEAQATLVVALQASLDVLRRRAQGALGPAPLSRGRWISPSERQVLDQLILGHSVREIAETLQRSPHTVHDHVKSLHRKLGASSRGELVARALGHDAHPWHHATHHST